jgi:hypothetical protein
MRHSCSTWSSSSFSDPFFLISGEGGDFVGPYYQAVHGLSILIVQLLKHGHKFINHHYYHDFKVLGFVAVSGLYMRNNPEVSLKGVLCSFSLQVDIS